MHIHSHPCIRVWNVSTSCERERERERFVSVCCKQQNKTNGGGIGEETNANENSQFKFKRSQIHPSTQFGHTQKNKKRKKNSMTWIITHRSHVRQGQIK